MLSPYVRNVKPAELIEAGTILQISKTGVGVSIN
jgi:hypothetical protein